MLKHLVNESKQCKESTSVIVKADAQWISIGVRDDRIVIAFQWSTLVQVQGKVFSPRTTRDKHQLSDILTSKWRLYRKSKLSPA